MNAKLRHFWFKEDPLPAGGSLGYGITAWSEDDASALLREKVFAGADLPNGTLTADIDLSQLSKKITPNMRPPVWRGIWFPLGYSDDKGR